MITTDGNVRKRLPLVSDCDHFWITTLEIAIVFTHLVSEHLGPDLISLFETTHIIVTYKLHILFQNIDVLAGPLLGGDTLCDDSCKRPLGLCILGGRLEEGSLYRSLLYKGSLVL